MKNNKYTEITLGELMRKLLLSAITMASELKDLKDKPISDEIINITYDDLKKLTTISRLPEVEDIIVTKEINKKLKQIRKDREKDKSETIY